MIAPDSTITLDFALARLAGVIDKLVVYPEAMRKNLDRLGGSSIRSASVGVDPEGGCA